MTDPSPPEGLLASATFAAGDSFIRVQRSVAGPPHGHAGRSQTFTHDRREPHPRQSRLHSLPKFLDLHDSLIRDTDPKHLN